MRQWRIDFSNGSCTNLFRFVEYEILSYFLLQCHIGYTNVAGIDKSPNAIKLATEVSHQECVKVNLQVSLFVLFVGDERSGVLLLLKYLCLLKGWRCIRPGAN